MKYVKLEDRNTFEMYPESRYDLTYVRILGSAGRPCNAALYDEEVSFLKMMRALLKGHTSVY